MRHPLKSAGGEKRAAPPPGWERRRGSPRRDGTYIAVWTPFEPSDETLKWIHMPAAAWPGT